MSAVVHATAIERIAHYAQLWRDAEKAAIGDRSDKQLQRAEYQARQALRLAVDIAARSSCAPECKNLPRMSSFAQ
ncbi:hypothetical protein E7V67_006245 [[Empedobacter] haloabium]|uniref:Uncharacterized protein n=1 Tax=[Empedobacter] haloabium TaxID=592317 RepID=A0ABZ1UPP5_9BURK